NNVQAEKLADENHAKIAQNVAAGVVGVVVWPVWFAMDAISATFPRQCSRAVSRAAMTAAGVAAGAEGSREHQESDIRLF
ncbi:MAG: hypothetical protein WBW06_05135, partial [Xanthobacteraceae bacterium]